jgi:hypothetical protein
MSRPYLWIVGRGGLSGVVVAPALGSLTKTREAWLPVVSALGAVTASIVCDPLIGGNGEPWMISSMLVVPYPPGFPVLVPGQVISKEILYFLAQLDVKEIHGYKPQLGLSVFTEAAIARFEAGRLASNGKADAVAPPPDGNYSRMWPLPSPPA